MLLTLPAPISAAIDSAAGDGSLPEALLRLTAWLESAPAAGKATALAVATFVSEDLTTILAGLLVARDELSLTTALVGCTAGIWIGDGLLWLVGRTLGQRALKLPILRRMIQPWQLTRAQRWFKERGLRIVLVSRFLPGSRLPVFFAAGVLGAQAGWFLGWALLAALLWTPLLVGLAMVAAPQIEALVSRLGELQGFWKFLPPLLSLLALVAVLQLLELATSWRARRRLRARWIRRLHWEFWPPWLIYAPAVLWYLVLAIRHRSLTLPTVANPGIDGGGFIGESKAEILERLVAGRPEAQTLVARTLLLPAGDGARWTALAAWLASEKLSFPIILKPDVGQRGSGVRKVQSEAEAREYLSAVPLALVAQEYAEGPHELGVFWYRAPGEARGRILSVTEKFFPEVVGDGSHTLEDLILLHPRAMIMADTFYRRHSERLDWVPGIGATFPLVTSGNHCQGTLFRNGGRLASEALLASLDTLADAYPGLCVGRFDLRAPELGAVTEGRGFKIVEVNGATAEATHIYDPAYGPLRGPFVAWRSLLNQWSLVFRIGAANRRAGHRPLGPRALIGRILAFRRQARHHPLAS
ncbi:MAG: VTT domain-containing protein [Planctomycetota bacterium]